MSYDTTYIINHGRNLARVLQRSGDWDEALAVLPDGEIAARAEIATERFFWRLGDPAGALAAITELASADPVLAAFCGAQLAYTRLIFQVDPGSDDRDRARDGFTAAARDRRLAGWGTFWLGVLADHVDDDPEAAVTAYGEALSLSRQHDDLLLASYAIRHQGDHALAGDKAAGIALLRRSYYLRAALSARPQTAAAAATLAAALPPGREADQLRESAAITAGELQLTWLLRGL
jgi:hypothetical protein